eukprot:2878957-Rhodomonas_salina.1
MIKRTLTEESVGMMHDTFFGCAAVGSKAQSPNVEAENPPNKSMDDPTSTAECPARILILSETTSLVHTHDDADDRERTNAPGEN